MKRVLFVDDETLVLQGLRRALRALRHGVEMVFVPDPAKALSLIERQHFDVVVSDMRMPVIDGATFLTEVARISPRTVRVVLSGYCEGGVAQRAAGIAHQFLAKPVNASVVAETLMRLFKLRDLVESPAILERIGGLTTLPARPDALATVQAELGSSVPDFDVVAAAIESDVALTTKILQLVNSSFFGVKREIAEIGQAVRHLGLDRVRDLVLDEGLRASFGRKLAAGFDFAGMQRRARVATTIATHCTEDPALKPLSECAAQVHEAGIYVMWDSGSDAGRKLEERWKSEPSRRRSLETECWGVSHAEVGAVLLSAWNLPDPVVEAVAFHLHPSGSKARRFDQLGAVHVGSALALDPDGSCLDRDFLHSVGADDRVPEWIAFAQRLDANLDSPEMVA